MVVLSTTRQNLHRILHILSNLSFIIILLRHSIKYAAQKSWLEKEGREKE